MNTTIKWISIFLLKKFIITKNADFSNFEKHLTINLKILIFLTWSISPEIVDFNLTFYKKAQCFKVASFYILFKTMHDITNVADFNLSFGKSDLTKSCLL